MSENKKERKSHAKHDEGWEREVSLTEGKLQKRYHEIRLEYPAVTRREAQCVTLAEHGYKNGEIAEILGVQPCSIDNYTSEARHKVGAERRTRLRNILSPAKKNPESKNEKFE